MRSPGSTRAASGNEEASRSVAVLASANEGGAFDDVPFETAWTLLGALAKSVK